MAIVAGGGAGRCAAALRNGASVIIVEKQDETGGHSQHAGAAAVFNTRVSRKAELKFDREAAFKHAYGIGSKRHCGPASAEHADRPFARGL